MKNTDCLICGETYKPRRESSLYCSSACYKAARTAGLYRQQKGKPCGITDCDRPVVAKYLCNVHYQRRAEGMPDWDTRPIRQKDGSGWTRKGYRMVYRPKHPSANKAGVLFEHVFVMSNHLGRPLYADENVHHINGDRADNRLQNLELWSTKQPPGQRVVDKLAYARELIARYEADVESEKIC